MHDEGFRNHGVNNGCALFAGKLALSKEAKKKKKMARLALEKRGGGVPRVNPHQVLEKGLS